MLPAKDQSLLLKTDGSVRSVWQYTKLPWSKTSFHKLFLRTVNKRGDIDSLPEGVGLLFFGMP
jgi:hypothetical protein